MLTSTVPATALPGQTTANKITLADQVVCQVGTNDWSQTPSGTVSQVHVAALEHLANDQEVSSCGREPRRRYRQGTGHLASRPVVPDTVGTTGDESR